MLPCIGGSLVASAFLEDVLLKDIESQPTGEQLDAILTAAYTLGARSVLVVGKPADGLGIIGPVNADDPDMLRYAQDHPGDWWLLPLTPLAEALATPARG